MKDITVSLIHLFYIYNKSSKKLRELRQFHTVLKNIYKFENNQVKPVKATGTRWIAHVMRSMSALIDKFGLYLQHMENVISDTSKQGDKATLEGKRRKLVEAEMLLKSCLFVDLLDSAKYFSLASQYADIDVLLMVDRVDDMRLTYQLFIESL